MLNNYTQRYIIIIDIYAKKEKYSALNSIRFSTLKEKYCNLEGRKEPQFSFLFIICVVPSAGPFIVVKCLSEWKISADILTVHTTHANQCVLSKEHWYREVLILVVPGSGRQGSKSLKSLSVGRDIRHFFSISLCTQRRWLIASVRNQIDQYTGAEIKCLQRI